MKAEIISIGDELTTGKILDTNSRWLSLELAGLGIPTLFHTTVGDESAAIVEVLRVAVARADLIIATGGLGPTADDLTRQALADLAQVPLVRDDSLLDSIREMFRCRGREMPVSNESQAFLPSGAKAVPNPNGTAPGIAMKIERAAIREGVAERITGGPPVCRLFALPGVPAEMREMYHGTVEPELRAFLEETAGEKRVIRSRTIHSFGVGESQVEAMLPDIVNRNHVPRVGITASGAVISLRIVAEAATEAECTRQIDRTSSLIYGKLGKIIFGEGDDRLQDVVCRMLKQAGKTLAVAEVGTRGLLAEAVASARDAGDVFRGGLVLVGNPTLEEMASAAKNAFGSHVVLMVASYVGGPETRVALSENGCLISESYSRLGHPALLDDLFTRRALDLLRRTWTIEKTPE